MATRSAVQTDNFNRTGLGSNWTNVATLDCGDVASDTSNTKFQGGTVKTAGDGAVAAWAVSGTFTEDQYSSAVFADTHFDSLGYAIGVACRITGLNTTRNYYVFMAHSNDANFLGKVINGSYTNLASPTATWADGDRVELEVEGTTIRAMKNGVAISGGTVTDSSSTPPTGGKPGIAASGSSSVANGDDWEGGNLVSAAGGWGGLIGPAINKLVIP